MSRDFARYINTKGREADLTCFVIIGKELLHVKEKEGFPCGRLRVLTYSWYQLYDKVRKSATRSLGTGLDLKIKTSFE